MIQCMIGLLKMFYWEMVEMRITLGFGMLCKVGIAESVSPA